MKDLLIGVGIIMIIAIIIIGAVMSGSSWRPDATGIVIAIFVIGFVIVLMGL